MHEDDEDECNEKITIYYKNKLIMNKYILISMDIICIVFLNLRQSNLSSQSQTSSQSHHNHQNHHYLSKSLSIINIHHYHIIYQHLLLLLLSSSSSSSSSSSTIINYKYHLSSSLSII